MTTANDTTARIVYQSPEGRVRVERESRADYALYLDGSFNSYHRTSAVAELAGLIWLNEQAAELAFDLADEAAARDALVEQADPCQRCGEPATRTSHGQALCATCDPRGPDAASCAAPVAPTPPAGGDRAVMAWRWAGCASTLSAYIGELRGEGEPACYYMHASDPDAPLFYMHASDLKFAGVGAVLYGEREFGLQWEEAAWLRRFDSDATERANQAQASPRTARDIERWLAAYYGKPVALRCVVASSRDDAGSPQHCYGFTFEVAA